MRSQSVCEYLEMYIGILLIYKILPQAANSVKPIKMYDEDVNVKD